ncbi:DNA-dependent protein kinase catalytic subunit [Anabrus simplex]|uniref:DNA-dependent protein kinase catalytic subunit n=1 Tax=Anabrus simplex TaxID=316456 RepID=UPI0035A2DC01
MAEDLSKLLEGLNRCILTNSSSDAKDLVLSIQNFFKDELSKPDLDSAFPALFSDDTGIIRFYNVASLEHFRNAVIEVFELFKYLIHNFRERLSPYVLIIKEACMSCVSKFNSTAAEREKAFDVLLFVLKGGPWQQDLGVETLVNDLFQHMSCYKPPPKVLQKIYHILGVISHYYPECMVSKSDKLLKMYIKVLDQQVHFSNKASFPVITGCLDGLNEYLCTFAQTLEENPELCKKIYGYIKELSSPDVDKRVAQRAALRLIEFHGILFARYLFIEYSWWHGQLLKWQKKSSEDRVAGMKALITFYKEIACIIQETPDDQHKAVLKFFISYFKEKMLNEKVTIYEMGEVIKGFGLFAGACLRYMRSEDVQVMFTQLIQRAQHTYLNSSLTQDQKQKGLQNLPDYVESIANIILQLGTVTPDQLAVLQHIAVFLFQNFANVPEKFHSSSVEAFTTLFYSLSTCKGIIFEDFIKITVYQGVVRTCSHPVAIDAELLKEQTGSEKVITYKNYIPLWLSVLNVQSYQEKGVPLIAKKAIVIKLYDHLLQSVLILLKKLDLTTKKIDGNTIKEYDPNGGLRASIPQDFQIFYNLVDLCSDVLPKCDLHLFEKWVQPFIYCVIMESSVKPIVSGFYRLLTISLDLSEKLNYFTTSHGSLYNLVYHFLEDMLARLKHYKAELQIACLQTLIATPVCMVPRLLHIAADAFQAIFKIGRSYLKIAHQGLTALENWTKSLSSDDMKRFLKEVLPYLDTYLQSRGVEYEADKELEMLESSSSSSSRRRHMLKRNLLTERPDTELQQLQRRILHFLGPLDSGIVESLLVDPIDSLSTWRNSRKLEFSLPFKDMRPVIYLDHLLPRIVDLALTCSDRRTRIAACELLHAITMFMLGTSVQIASADHSELSELFEKLFMPLLQLGCCDSDQIIYQLFHPLVLQLAHWYSSAFQLKSKNTATLIDTLLDALTDPADSALRNIAAECLCEFVVWAIRQHHSHELDNSPINVRFIIKRIELLCMHPSSSKRFGGALAFNSIYAVLREDKAVVDEFWLELLYYLMENLAQTKPEEVMTGSVTELESAVDHIERVLKAEASVFNKPSARRRQPCGIAGILLSDAVLWLLKQCGHHQVEYRRKSMKLVCSLSPLLPGCKSTRSFIDNFIETEGLGNLVQICEGGIISVQRSMSTMGIPEDTLNWLQLLLASLDCYTWLIGKGLVSLDILKSKTSRIQEEILFFMQQVNSKWENEESSQFSPSEKSQCKLIKCKCIVQLCEFLVAVLNELNDGSGVDFIQENLFGSPLWHFLGSCLFTPVQVGFDLRCSEVVQGLPGTLEQVLTALKKGLASSYLLHSFYAVLREGVTRYTTPFLDCLEEILRSNVVSQEQQTSVETLVILHKSNMLHQLSQEFYEMGSRIMRKVFLSLVEQPSGMVIALQPSVQKFGEALLKLAFYLQTQISDILDYVRDGTEVKNPYIQSVVEHGEYFLICYQQCLFEHLLNFPEDTVNGLLDGLTPDHSSRSLRVLEHFLHYADENRKQKLIYADRCASAVLQHWPALLSWADTSTENCTQLLLLLNQVAACSKQPIGRFMSHDYVKKWIITQLVAPDLPLHYKNHALDLLPCLASKNQKSDSELENALQKLREQHFPQFSSELSPSSLQRDSFVLAFCKLLRGLEVSGSPVLLRSVIASSVQDKQHLCNENIQKTLPSFIFRLDAEQQLHAIDITYNIFWDDKLYAPETRIGCVERYLVPLVRACNIPVLERFFSNHVHQMLAVIVQKLDSSRIIRMEHQLVTCIGIWQLLELLFSSYPVEQLESKNCPITVAAFLGAVNTGKEFITDITRKAFNVRTETLPVRGKDSPTVMEFFRVMQCAAYKTLSVVISNSKKEEKFYAGFLFNENREKNQLVWENLVDCNKNFTFAVDWDELPRCRKVLISIRKEVSKGSAPVNYIPIDSQLLFSSTLSEDVTRFDFSTSVVREIFNIPAPQQSTEVELEVDTLNSHECMATLCAVVQHLGAEIPSEEPTSLPTWMECLRKSLMTNHKNVRVFLMKLILNNQTVFQPYAKFWLCAILQVIVDGCFGFEMNYMVTDTVEMLVIWSSKAIPSSTETEKLVASQVVNFLMTNAGHSRRDIFKYNLELIKSVVEVWKCCVNFPHQFIVDQLNAKGNTRMIELGIQLTGILLANNVAPWSYSGKERFLILLSSNLDHNDRLIFKPCSEVVGMALKFLDAQLTGELLDEDAKFRSVVYKKLQALQPKLIDTFLLSLYGIHKHYPLVVDSFLNIILFHLPKVSGSLKTICVELILKRVELLGNSAYAELKGKGLFGLLQNHDSDTQLLSLRLIHKMLPNLDKVHLQELLDIVVELICLKNVKCRAVAFQILMWAYDHHSLGEKGQAALVAGLLDSDLDLRATVMKFWNEEKNLPSETTSRLQALLTKLYSPDSEEHFLNYGTRLLMNVMMDSPDYEMKIFQHPLSDCSFQDLQVLASWRARHASFAPMFADTFSSQLSRFDSLDGSSFPKLKATQASLAFQPTMEMGMFVDDVTSRIQKISSSSTSSSLLFKIDTSISSFNNRSNHQNITPGDRSIAPQRRRRFLRDQKKISSMHAMFEAKKASRRQQLHQERVHKQEANVVMCRSYRIGDFPDIEIAYSAILKPLQVLAEHDDMTGRLVFVSIFSGVMSKLNREEANLFAAHMSTALGNIVNKTIQTTPMFIGAILEIAFAHNHMISLDTDSILKVSKSSGLFSLGILLLEGKLMALPDTEPAAKKRSFTLSEEQNCWLRLAELYQNLDEWDVVHGVFSKKIRCHDSVKLAIKAESNSCWDEAQEFYKRAIFSSDPDNQKDFYYEAYYKCLANLSKWEELLTCIEQQLEGNLDSVWEDEWSKTKLLPWLFISELQLMGSRDCSRFLTALQFWCSAKEKNSYMKTYLNEELAVLCILEKNFVMARVYASDSHRLFLEKWSHLNVSAFKQRALTLQDLHRQAELWMFLNFGEMFTLGNASDLSDQIEQLCCQWRNSLPSTSSCLIDWDRRIAYRNHFATQLKEKLGYEPPCLESAESEMQLAMIDVSLGQCNFHVARKYLTLGKQKLANSSNPQVRLRWNMGFSKCHWLTSRKTDQAPEKIKLIMKAWNRLRECDWKECPSLERVSYQQTSVYAQSIWQLLGNNPSLLDDVGKGIADQLIGWTNPSSSSEGAIRQALCQHGFTCLQQAVCIAENDGTTVSHDIADAYYKLAEYCQAMYGDKSKEPHIVTSVLRAMKYGSPEARQLFPCLLQIQQLATDWRELFDTESSDVPEWMFLGWVNQLMACLNVSVGQALHSLVLRLAKKYPQAIAYAFRVSREKYTYSADPDGLRTKDLITRLETLLMGDTLMETFLRSMSSLVVPELLFEHHLKKLIAVSSEEPMNIQRLEATYHTLLAEVYEDGPTTSKVRGEAFSVLNNHREPLEKAVEILRCGTGIKQGVMALQNIQKALQNSRRKHSSSLRSYSPWLDEFQGSHWVNGLELPGQYSGESCPLPQYHIKIASFQKQVVLMNSIRHPIRITILGNDAKEHRYLVKFGEDLRQDQRIEQMFGLMNKILKQDPACFHRKLQIITYQVVPLSCTLGMIQWMDGTETFKQVLLETLSDEEKEKWQAAILSYKSWLCKASGKENLPIFQLYRNAYIKYSRSETVASYNEKVNMIPWDIFKRAIFNLSSSPEDYFIRRHSFACSYAVLCIAHWLLGIGDRHLENCMLLKSNCCCVGIDFGHAFGTATQLPVPELMPFRMTPHILNLLAPLQEIGTIMGTMVHCLRALRSSCRVLVATMNVFIQEPSMDWLEQVHRQQSCMGELPVDESEWYPQQKVLLARRKLEGANPTTITSEELKSGNSRTSQYLPKFLEIVQGDIQHNVRARLPADNLTSHEQVECLLDMATDPHLLGKTWEGWYPWI